MADESKHRRIFRGAPDAAPEVEGDADEPTPRARRPRVSRAGLETESAMSFTAHIVSLNLAALVQMGLVEDEDRTTRPNPEAARLLIDTLAMLQAKTRGNLDADEAQLLDTFLYELRMRYVEVKRGS